MSNGPEPFWTTLKEDQPRIIPVKFGQNPISDLGGDIIWIFFLRKDAGRHNGLLTKCDHKAHLVTIWQVS